VTTPIVVVKGSDGVLVADAVIEVVGELVGDQDRNEVMETFSGDDYELTEAVLAASAVSMFGSRVIVMRNGARFGADEIGPLLTYLADPNPTSSIVLAWEKPLTAGAAAKPFSKKMTEAVKACGGEVRAVDVGSSDRARRGWIDERLAEAAVTLDGAARAAVADALGDDVSRLVGIVRVLEGAFDAGSRLGVDDVAPFLGESGGVPPWDLTDAIDKGDVALAVRTAQRMMVGGERHPLAIMSSVVTHFQRMYRLDGSGVSNERDAAALLGMKGSTYPARKALDGSKRLGSDALARSIELLATADTDLRGATGLPPDAVMEVLVARLAALSRGRKAGSRR
jgi:DNA polymerase-3 subunit delta